MDNDTVRLALVIVALVLAGIDVVRSGFQGLTSWAAVAISVALLTAWWPES